MFYAKYAWGNQTNLQWGDKDHEKESVMQWVVQRLVQCFQLFFVTRKRNNPSENSYIAFKRGHKNTVLTPNIGKSQALNIVPTV